MELQFNDLPKVVCQIQEKLNHVEHLITNLNQFEPDRWFSIEELCEYLPGKPAKATIYRYVQNREIPFNKYGKRLAFLKSSVDLWLKEKHHKTISEIKAEKYLSKKKRG